MGIKSYKPTSPGRRLATVLDGKEITAAVPEKSLCEKIPNRRGRNNHGRITSRHRGGGHKTIWRRIDFKRGKDGIPARVMSIEYDPNRNCHIALVCYRDGEKRYIIAPRELGVGAEVLSGDKVDVKVGNCMPLRNIPQGVMVHNIEMRVGQGGRIARAAVRARRGDVPLRPSPGGRRGPQQGRPPAVLPDGPAGQGRQDPEPAQGERQVHHQAQEEIRRPRRWRREQVVEKRALRGCEAAPQGDATEGNQ